MSDEPIYHQMMNARLEQDHNMLIKYINGMEVTEIASLYGCETWVVQRAILGPAYGKEQS